MFQDKKYLLQLYKALHPEDTDVTEDDLTDITIKNVLTDNIYNDLGFTVGDKLMILVEAQSSVWTVNIIVRALMYLVQTWVFLILKQICEYTVLDRPFHDTFLLLLYIV